jgi:uncharacterized membrane protein (DUF106 family)
MVFDKITGMLVSAVNVAFGPIAATFSPAVALFLVSAFITILVIILNKVLTDRKIIAELRDKMEAVRENLTSAQKAGNKDEISKFLDEMMSLNAQLWKQMYKTMFISLVVLLVFLPWVREHYTGMTVAELPFRVPVVGSSINWILWYILVSFTIGWVVRKVFGFD